MILLILLIIWICCVLVNIRIALNYGNKEIVRGAVMGLLLGPFGIPVFISLANFDKRLNSPVDITKQCISCGKEGHFDRYRYYAGILHRTSESGRRKMGSNL
jgi:hypothetical protein